MVLEWEPELFIYFGDNICGDTNDMAVLEAKYAKMGAKKEFKALRASVPTIATWDDWENVEPNRNRVGEPCSDFHFGMLDINWSGNPSVTFRIHDMTGRARVRKSVRLSELKF